MRAIQLVQRVYALLLHLYPASFRREFGREMQATLADALADVSTRGTRSLWRICIRELAALPFGALRERWREKSKGQMNSVPWGHKPHAWWAWLLAFAPFGIVILIIVMNLLRQYLPQWVALVLLVLLACPVLIGLVRGLPDWSIASLGVLAAVVNLLLFNEQMQEFGHWFLSPYHAAVRAIIDPGLPWLGLIGMTAVFLVLTALLRPLRPFFHSVQNDWTTLSFALYSAMLMALLITFDEYQGEELFLLAALVALGAGVVFYFRSIRQDWRLAALVGGIVAAWVLVAIAKWVLIPDQNWGGVIPTDQVPARRWSELTYTAVTAAWMFIVIVLVPALLGRLTRLSFLLPAQSRL